MTSEKKVAMVKAEDNEPRRDLEAQRQEEGHSGGGGPEAIVAGRWFTLGTWREPPPQWARQGQMAHTLCCLP